ncbi:endonuclease/exonuclease/phosphatase family protein [Candidatus Pacearchaeota archaeon]|nr:endonuclease/exonuclease/phosphatase family protein [Candidatus Pacearchaeota archaeon]
MRVAVYNQMFGLNGRNLFSNLAGHYSIHYMRNSKSVYKSAKISRTLDLVSRSNADVVGICEVLEGQEVELGKGLRETGYDYVFFGNGHRTKSSKLKVRVAIASKVPCKQVSKVHTLDFPVKDEMSGGGGIVHCYFPKLDFNMINVHLANPKKQHLYLEQIAFLEEYIEELNGRVVLAGDFNSTYLSLKDNFGDFSLFSDQIKTCSLTPIMKWFFWKDCDHIFARGFNVKDKGYLEGRSDHRLIYADLN